MKEENFIYIDEAESLINIDLPIGSDLLRTRVLVHEVLEENIRVILSRARSFLELEQKQNKEKENIEDLESLEKMKRVLFTQKEFLKKAIVPLFLSEAVEVIDNLEKSDGTLMSKEDFLEWLNGDFIMAWARVFFFYFEMGKAKLKKKFD